MTNDFLHHAILYSVFIIVSSFVVSMFCLGLSKVSEKGMLLYFLRKPLDDYRQKVEDWFSKAATELALKKEERVRFWNKNYEKQKDEQEKEKCLDQISEATEIYSRNHKAITKRKIFKINVLYPFKPIILCSICMASVWGVVVMTGIYGWALFMLKPIIIICFSSAYLNSKLQ